MLILIHGNDLSAIGNKITQLKSSFEPLSVNELSVKSLGWEQVCLDLSTSGLFEEKRLVILEDLDPNIELEKIPDNESLTVVLKITKQLPQTSKILKSAVSKKAQILLFAQKEDSKIFLFLDLLAEKKPPALNNLDKLIDDEGGQYILSMIFYMLRRLVVTPKGLPPFVVNKIEKQKRLFNSEDITHLYKVALEADFKIKTGILNEKLALTLLTREILKS